ncbi:unnamed protein product, partial [marine sediment metagenome]
MKKVKRIKIEETNTLVALPIDWQKDKLSIVLKLPEIRPPNWHLTIQFGYNPAREHLFLNCHWTDEIEKAKVNYKREPVLDIKVSTKDLE